MITHHLLRIIIVQSLLLIVIFKSGLDKNVQYVAFLLWLSAHSCFVFLEFDLTSLSFLDLEFNAVLNVKIED